MQKLIFIYSPLLQFICNPLLQIGDMYDLQCTVETEYMMSQDSDVYPSVFIASVCFTIICIHFVFTIVEPSTGGSSGGGSSVVGPVIGVIMALLIIIIIIVVVIVLLQ